MFYEVKFSETLDAEENEEKTCTYSKVFEVRSEKQLKEKISAYIAENAIGNPEVIEKTQVSIESLVEEAKQVLFNEIFNRYLHVKLKPHKKTPQVYAELKNKYLHEPEYFYKMLQYEIKTMRVEEYLGRYNPHFVSTMKDISAKQYFDRVTMLSEGGDAIGD